MMVYHKPRQSGISAKPFCGQNEGDTVEMSGLNLFIYLELCLSFDILYKIKIPKLEVLFKGILGQISYVPICVLCPLSTTEVLLHLQEGLDNSMVLPKTFLCSSIATTSDHNNMLITTSDRQQCPIIFPIIG